MGSQCHLARPVYGHAAIGSRRPAVVGEHGPLRSGFAHGREPEVVGGAGFDLRRRHAHRQQPLRLARGPLGRIRPEPGLGRRQLAVALVGPRALASAVLAADTLVLCIPDRCDLTRCRGSTLAPNPFIYSRTLSEHLSEPTTEGPRCRTSGLGSPLARHFRDSGGSPACRRGSRCCSSCGSAGFTHGRTRFERHDAAVECIRWVGPHTVGHAWSSPRARQVSSVRLGIARASFAICFSCKLLMPR
mmetsp:Transcript_92162/g.234295  ORF Transcript_92162/g.234295 Transcript_92162/m.234295 type:complete len:245 (-) Transcript_92162:119-853(-)